ncbi:MAG: hypothetical protein KDK54_21960 [Leptospiraceae bacterium]|nr:hypothetical protein [Leptospiraceae bacterium]
MEAGKYMPIIPVTDFGRDRDIWSLWQKRLSASPNVGYAGDVERHGNQNINNWFSVAKQIKGWI